MIRRRIAGRCKDCNTYSPQLYAVPEDNPGRDGRVLYKYICGPCWHGVPDPFDDPDEAAIDRATEADLQ